MLDYLSLGKTSIQISGSPHNLNVIYSHDHPGLLAEGFAGIRKAEYVQTSQTFIIARFFSLITGGINSSNATPNMSFCTPIAPIYHNGDETTLVASVKWSTII